MLLSGRKIAGLVNFIQGYVVQRKNKWQVLQLHVRCLTSYMRCLGIISHTKHDPLQRKGLGHPGLCSGHGRPFQIDWEPFVSRLGTMVLRHRMDECRKMPLRKVY